MRNVALVCLTVALAMGAVSCKSKKKPKSAGQQTGSFSSEIKDKIDDTIKDKVRKQRLTIMLDDAEACIVEALDIYVSCHQKLDIDPTATRAQAEATMAPYKAAREKCIQTIVDGRLAMRKEMSPQEWAAVFAVEDKKSKDAKPETTQAPAEAAVAPDVPSPAVDAEGVQDTAEESTPSEVTK